MRFHGIILIFMILQTLSSFFLWYRFEGHEFVTTNSTNAQKEVCMQNSKELVSIKNSIHELVSIKNNARIENQKNIDLDLLKNEIAETINRQVGHCIVQRNSPSKEPKTNNNSIDVSTVDYKIESAADRILEAALNAGIWTQDDSQALRDAGTSNLSPSGRQRLMNKLAKAINSQRLRIENPSSFLGSY